MADQAVDVLVIGGGQAGLAAGYHLRRRGVDFVIVDGRARTGDSWRERWDSLELFTPKPFAALPGMQFPEAAHYYPSRDEVAAYLETYATHFDLPVRHGVAVRSITGGPEGFTATTDHGVLGARCVVLATGPHVTPFVPREARDGLAPDVVQVHTSEYVAPDDVPHGRVLVVGGGNSAGQIAEELSVDREVTLASRGPLVMGPKAILGVSIFRIMNAIGYLRLDKDSALARYVRPYSDAIVGLGLRRAISAGRLRHVPHAVVGAAGREVEFADGSRHEVDAVVWGTGFRPDYPWVRVDCALDADGAPVQDRGHSPVPGLYWLGLPWQSRLDSALVAGVGTDAEQIVGALTARLREGADQRS